MPHAILRILTVAVLWVGVTTPAVHAQSPVWWNLSPRLLPPTDDLAPRTDVVDPLPDAPVALGLSLGRWLDAESSLALDVTRFRPDLGLSRIAIGVEPAAGSPYRLIDSNLQHTALSIDLKLIWPSPRESSGSGLQPYLAFGPAVFVAERNPFANPLGTLADVAVRIGLIASAGVSWQFDAATALFGEYRLLRGTDNPVLSSGGRLGSGSGVSGHDLLYGFRLRF